MLTASGADSSEKRSDSLDSGGRLYRRQQWMLATTFDELYYYNGKGQLWKKAGLDGVVTLYTNNTRGELEFTVLDYNKDDLINRSGTDRIRQTVSDVISNYGTTVRRTRQYVWATNNVDAATLTRTSETSADGLRQWETVQGQTAQTIAVYAGNGVRWVTNIAPDTSYVVSQYQHGRLLSTARYLGGGTQLASTSYGYDAHGRQTSVIDARNGTTSFTFDDLDRVTSTRTPVPGLGLNAQVTTNYFDELGRIWKMGLPDGGAVTNEYYLTGELKKTYGTRQYPVEYIYDTGGRLKTNITWQNFAGSAGAATTRWDYEPYSGLFISKTYNDGRGYTNTIQTFGGGIGQAASRTWARGLTITRSYNCGSRITTIRCCEERTSRLS